VRRSDFDLRGYMTPSNRLGLWQLVNTLVP